LDRDAACRTGKPARRFKQFKWTTRRSWSRERRVVAKAECTQGEANPRFIVTSSAQLDSPVLSKPINVAPSPAKDNARKHVLARIARNPRRTGRYSFFGPLREGRPLTSA
jgi:hypothetical protein